MDEIGLDISLDIEVDDMSWGNIAENDMSDEEIDPEKLEKRILKDRIKLKRIKERKKHFVGDQTLEKQKYQKLTEKAKREKMSQACGEVMKYMSKLVEVCDARGFVFGIIPNKGKAVSGASDNLKGWWQENVKFDKNGPTAIAEHEAECDVIVERYGGNSKACVLTDLHDITLGSILSSLIKHCDPPQNMFKFDKGIPPPWWPTGKEEWWDKMGLPKGYVPPYKKPHDLKKIFKVVVLTAVIRHMSPNFEKIKKLVQDSKCLKNRKSEKENMIWCSALSRLEALINHTSREIVEAPVNTRFDQIGYDVDGSSFSSRDKNENKQEDEQTRNGKRQREGDEHSREKQIGKQIVAKKRHDGELNCYSTSNIQQGNDGFQGMGFLEKYVNSQFQLPRIQSDHFIFPSTNEVPLQNTYVVNKSAALHHQIPQNSEIVSCDSAMYHQYHDELQFSRVHGGTQSSMLQYGPLNPSLHYEPQNNGIDHVHQYPDLHQPSTYQNCNSSADFESIGGEQRSQMAFNDIQMNVSDSRVHPPVFFHGNNSNIIEHHYGKDTLQNGHDTPADVNFGSPITSIPDYTSPNSPMNYGNNITGHHYGKDTFQNGHNTPVDVHFGSRIASMSGYTSPNNLMNHGISSQPTFSTS